MSSSNSNVAKAYAKSAIALGIDNKIDIAAELTVLQELIKVSNDLENVLFLEIFTIEEKLSVLNAVFKKLNFSSFSKNFLLFLIHEMRINLFPQIYKEIMVIDDHKKGFIKVDVYGVEDEMSSEAEELISSYLKEKLKMIPKIQYKRNRELIAGHRVVAEDLLLDTSLNNQFEIFKKSIFGD